jgi:NitT/TauT family transport system substrate-binding protein
VKRSAALALLASSSAMLAVPAAAQSLTLVRIGGGLNDDITPVLYAMQIGIFKKAGLDVQLQSSAIGAVLAAAVVGGALDIAKSSLMSLITGYDHGVKFKLIAGGAVYSSDSPTSQICVLKDAPYQSIAEANGKTVACVALRALDQLGSQALIDKNGGNSASVKFVEMPYTAMLGGLERGAADFALIGVPVLATALASGKIRTLGDPFAGIAPRILIAGWFTTQEYVARNPTVVQRFADGVRTATVYTNAHHAETVPLLAEYSHIDPDAIRKMQRGTNAVALNESEIQPAIDAGARYKYIEHAFPAKNLLVDG